MVHINHVRLAPLYHIILVIQSERLYRVEFHLSHPLAF